MSESPNAHNEVRFWGILRGVVGRIKKIVNLDTSLLLFDLCQNISQFVTRTCYAAKSYKTDEIKIVDFNILQK